MNRIILKYKILTTLLFFAVFLFGSNAFGQTTGDYRSFASGSWTTPGNWEYYNGSAWVTSTTTPGQNAGMYAVLVQAGHTISIGTSGITTQTMGTVTISGTLSLTGGGSSITTFDIKTTKLVVTPGLSPAATISFQDKATLVLPTNAELQVSTGGLSTVGGCNANQEIQIGSTKITSCTGGTKFSTTMTNGGYNANCATFSLTGVTATQACEVGKQSTVSLTSNSAGLPAGNYTIEYRLSYNGYSTVYTAPMTVITAGSGSFTANLAILSRDQSTSIRIDKLTSGSCTSNISSNNVSNSFFIARSNNPPVAAGYESCNNWIIQWSNDLVNVSAGDGYYLDVAKDVNFTIFVSGYQNLFMGNVTSHTLTGLARGGTYHYRVRSKNYCGTSVNSNVISFTEDGNSSSNAGTISGGDTTVCVGSNTPAFINTGSNPSPGVWSIYPISGDATITSAGVVTGTSPGTVNVVYTVGSGCVTSKIQPLTITGGTIGTASSSPTPCINTVMTSINHTVIGFTGIGTVTNLPTGVTPSLSGNTLTISGTPTASGPFNYIIQLTGSCGNANATGTIIVNDKPTIAAISAPFALCPGDSLSLTAPTVTANGSTVSAQGWEISTTPGGATYTTLTLPYTVAFADNGKNIRYTATNSCGISTSNVVGLTVNPDSGVISLNGTSIPSGNATYSPNSIAVFSSPAITGATYSWSVPTGWNIISGDGTDQIIVTTGTNLQSGPVMVIVNSLCSSSLFVSLSSTPLPGLNFNPTPIKCSALGSIDFSDLPAGNWTLTVVKDGVISFIKESGATRTVGSLLAGTYTIIITDQYGGSASATVILNLLTKAWKTVGSVTGWYIDTTPSTVPLSKEDFVVFEEDYNGSDSINACSCTVNSTADVTIASGKFLNIVHDLNVQGTLTFANGASLIQEDDDAVNTGVIKYNRTTSAIKNFDYVYWSSPVEGQTLGGFAPGSDKFYSRIGDDWDQRVGTDVMEAGYGYIARVPRDTSPQSVTFEGKPNNGDITVAVTSANDNLVGNPYPSAINADEFMTINSSRIKGSLSFWTHITKRKLNGSGTQYEYTVDDFAYYSLVGGVGLGEYADSSTPATGYLTPDGTIGAGQSFFVHSTAGNFVFNNGMRIAEDDKNGLFFKHANKKKRAKIEKNRVWLNLTNSDGAFKQLLVGYVTGATNDLDNLYDGTTNGGNAVIDFYSVMNTNRFMIQGRALPFDETDEVPLGYKSAIDGLFEISIGKTDGALANQAVYLEDKTANVVHDLTKGSYSFTTAKGEFTDRFVMRYTAKSTLGTGDFDAKGNGVIVSVKNSQIKVNSFDQTMQSVKVYDLKGSLAYQKDKINTNEFVIDQLNSSNQFMIVKVQLEDGKWVSEKIIFHD